MPQDAGRDAPVVRNLAEAAAEGLTVRVDRSEVDGVLVVFIDTDTLPEDPAGPILRVYLNEDPLYENPQFEGDAADSSEPPR